MSNNVLSIRNYIYEKANQTFKMAHFTDKERQDIINAAKMKFLGDSRPLEQVKTDIKKFLFAFADVTVDYKRVENDKYDLISFDKASKKVVTNVRMESTGLKTEQGYPIPDRVNVCFDGINTTIGYAKDSSYKDVSINFDDVEIINNWVGKYIGLDMAQEYRVYHKGIKHSLLTMSVETPTRKFKKFHAILNSLNSRIFDTPWYKRFMAIKERQVTLVDDNHIYKKVARVYEDYVATIGLGVHIFDTVVDTLINANVSEEDIEAQKTKFRVDYCSMLLFDCIINQCDRNMENWGYIFDSEKMAFMLAPIFNNYYVTNGILSSGDHSSLFIGQHDLMDLNGVFVDRSNVLDVLFHDYYEYIIDIVEHIVKNAEDIKTKYLVMCVKNNCPKWLPKLFNFNIDKVVDKYNHRKDLI